MTMRVLLCLLAVPAIGAAQEPERSSDVAAVFHALEGEWDGSGVLLDRPAEFRMEWHVGSGSFVRLSFSSAWVADDGQRTPVLQSEAIYLSRGSTVTGVWIDSRPQTIRLESTVTDSSLITTWTADAERGRTEYIVRSPDVVVVRDLVEVDGGFRLFGEASYERRVPTGGSEQRLSEKALAPHAAPSVIRRVTHAPT